MEILKTKDYDQFKTITSNRDVNRLHVKKLAESIKVRNLLWAKPPLVNEKMQIIDGQHRLEACQMVKADFFYMIASGLTKDDMAILNTNQKNWSSADFINYFTIEGKKDYVELSKLINKYEDLKVSMLIAFASGGQSWGGGLKRRAIQSHQPSSRPPGVRVDHADTQGASLLPGEGFRYGPDGHGRKGHRLPAAPEKLQARQFRQVLLRSGV